MTDFHIKKCRLNLQEWYQYINKTKLNEAQSAAINSTTHLVTKFTVHMQQENGHLSK